MTGNTKSKLCRALHQMLEYELLSTHSSEMRIPQFAAILNPIQM
jgi:hypothetical protein